ncbi:hypothetical protein [Runella sp.]|uniref:hypothetical protein n=1 Tax=Runella sp. TaxID=1960881 RepID=UPI0026298494|nr:hypothetical protein [Runella sp.]
MGKAKFQKGYILFSPMVSRFTFLLVFLAGFSHAQVTIWADSTAAPVLFAVQKLNRVSVQQGQKLIVKEKEKATVWVVSQADLPKSLTAFITEKEWAAIQPEGYAHRWIKNKTQLVILAKDALGAQYGVLELAEYWQINGTYKSCPTKLRIRS